jgi:MraZ protein
LFRGQHRHTIDEKGRLSIPAKFRDTLAGDLRPALFITVYKDCLVAYSATAWSELEKKLDEMPQFDPKVREFRRVFYSPAQECPIDKAGRVLVPPDLREHAKLDKDVVLAGLGKTFEIWNAASHATMSLAALDKLEETLQSMGDIGI